MSANTPKIKLDQAEYVRLATHRSADVRSAVFDLLQNPEAREHRFYGPSRFSKTDLLFLRLLCRSLAHDPHPHVRWQAIDALGYYGNHDDRRIALRYLDDENDTVRLCAVELLGDFPRKGDEKHILPLLKDPYYATRLYAIGALVKVLQNDALPCLIAHLSHEDDVEVKMDILTVLAQRSPETNWYQQLVALDKQVDYARAKDRYVRRLAELNESPDSSTAPLPR